MPTPEVILGNSNRRFSGVTSTMLQTFPGVSQRVPIAVLGPHHLPEESSVLSFREFTKLCREPLPDGLPRVFHARRNDEMLQALAAKKLFGAQLKIIFTSTAQRHHSKFTKALMRRMDAIITTCSAAGSYLDQPADVMIPHGVDLQRFQPPESKAAAWKKLGFPGDYGIGIFGRVRAQKGIDLLIDSAIPLLKDNPAPTLVIIGETTPKFRDYQEALEKKVAAAGLSERVIFHGKRPGSELPALFQGMSLVAALSRNEGFGLTVLEAMASGSAVLASHAGAWQDIISEGIHGFTVPCDDLSATREKLATLISDHDTLLEMGRAGRRHVEEHYTIDREAQSLCDFYRKIQNS
ncbi:glycosyltransferase family 4 protein [Akkermansiaceae bacterium]|nr:glycosyltransferase family 4 protein [Akkermansiaceae bacterium]